MKTLHLTLKKKWYDMIESGEKTEEYRALESWMLVRAFVMKKPFVMKQSTTRYDNLKGAFWFCSGFTGKRIDAIRMLIDMEVVEFRKYDQVKVHKWVS